MSAVLSLEISPQLTQLRDRYLQLYSEANECKLAYGRWVIANLEKSQTNLWYAKVVNTHKKRFSNKSRIDVFKLRAVKLEIFLKKMQIKIPRSHTSED